VRVIRRDGPYFRVADPEWTNPLDGSWSMRFGGRWNAPGSFPTVYLNRDRPTARANARYLLTKKLAGTFLTADDLDPTELPVLITAAVSDDNYVDVVGDDGCIDAGLPITYPHDTSGNPVDHLHCQPVGMEAWTAGELGIACRSAAEHAPADGEELAYFDRPNRRLTTSDPAEAFEEWYGSIDW
jgi:hypothetical protein